MNVKKQIKKNQAATKAHVLTFSAKTNAVEVAKAEKAAQVAKNAEVLKNALLSQNLPVEAVEKRVADYISLNSK